MTHRDSAWDEFARSGVVASRAMASGMVELLANAEHLQSTSSSVRLSELAQTAHDLATHAVRVGAEDVARLALAYERCVGDLKAARISPGAALPLLVSSAETLARALNGARTDGLPLRAALYELETLRPGPERPRSSGPGPDVPLTALTRRTAAGESRSKIVVSQDDDRDDS